MQSGKIVRGVGGLYEVRTDAGERLLCRARGSFRHDGTKPLAGDDVICSTQDAGGEPRIESIAPRRNVMIRPAFANLDVLFTVFAARDPEPSLLYVDKLLAIAEYQKIEPVVVVNKSDNDHAAAERYAALYRAAGFPVFLTDLLSGEGTDALRAGLCSLGNGRTAAFAGPSGVGKSTMLNTLFPSLSLQTGDLSEKIARGRHTTRSVVLYPLSELFGAGYCGYIADTPGFSMLDFEHFDFFRCEDLPGVFREFRPYLGQCRYKKCTHTKEDGCAVRAAVANGEIAKSRHDSFLALYEALKDKRDWTVAGSERHG